MTSETKNETDYYKKQSQFGRWNGSGSCATKPEITGEWIIRWKWKRWNDVKTGDWGETRERVEVTDVENKAGERGQGQEVYSKDGVNYSEDSDLYFLICGTD